MKRVGFCLLILFSFACGNAQQLTFFKPDNLRTLPSSECYNIMQDHRGYIWFSTEAGLCRFDGKTVKVFDKDGGVPENATYSLWEDKKGKIWATTSRNRIIQYDAAADSFKTTAFSNTCKNWFDAQLQQIYYKQTVGDSLLYLCGQYVTLCIDLRTNQVTKVNTTDSSASSFILTRDACIPVKKSFSIANRKLLDTKRIFYISLHKGSRTTRIVIPFPQKNSYVPESRVPTVAGKMQYFIGYENKLIVVNQDLSSHIIQVPGAILALYCDTDNGLWVSTYKNGVVYFADPLHSDHYIRSLSDVSVTGVIEDAEKGVWCTTLEKGVLYCRNKNVLSYSNVEGLSKRPEFARGIGEKLFTASDKNILFEIDADTVRKHLIDLPSLALPVITDILFAETSWLISSKGGTVRMDTFFKNEKTITHADSKMIMGANMLASTKDNRFFALGRKCLLEIDGNSYVYTLYITKSISTCIEATYNEGLLIGTRDGVYKVDPDKKTQEKIPGIEGYVSRIMQSKEGRTWIVTRDIGIFVLQDHKISKLELPAQLKQKRINDIAEGDSETIWLATNVGVVQWMEPFKRSIVRVYNSQHGLNSYEALQIALADGRTYVSSFDGLCSFPSNLNLINETAPPIYIDGVMVNGKKRDFSGQAIFASNENNFVVTLSIPVYKQGAQPIKFRYRIEGTKEDRIQEGTELSLPNLAPGNYTILFSALNSDNRASSKPALLHFTIDKPFWQKPLFLIGAMLVLISLAYFIANAIIRRIRRKEEEKTKVNKLLAEYQMSALRAQMNPHFIFNCINSIQKFILSNNAEQAYDYLSKFSKLIRLVLNYAEDNQISLQEELEIVNLYLELEQLRFDEKFTYEINISDDVDITEALVPVMLLQPYIENAIWHGLMHLEESKKGHILMNISMEDHVLQIVIEDNGVGLERSAALRKKEHRSRATEINNRRTQILNILESQTSGGIIIENILGRQGEITGTRVILKVPQNTYDDNDQ